jgi:hypothetical protein
VAPFAIRSGALPAALPAALLAAACGGSPSGSAGPDAATDATDATGGADSPSDAGAAVAVTLGTPSAFATHAQLAADGFTWGPSDGSPVVQTQDLTVFDIPKDPW